MFIINFLNHPIHSLIFNIHFMKFSINLAINLLIHKVFIIKFQGHQNFNSIEENYITINLNLIICYIHIFQLISIINK